MTPPPVPHRDPIEGEPRPDALEQALRAQELLPEPPGLAARVTASLAPPSRRVLSLPALARLAAAVVLALGTWIAAFGGVPTLAHAAPSPVVGEVLAPARELLPASPVEATSAALERARTEGEDVPVGVLAGLGALLVAAGLVLARRDAKEPTS